MKAKWFIKSVPHLPVINLGQTLDYYRDTLGFYEEWTEGKTDGGIRWEYALTFWRRCFLYINHQHRKITLKPVMVCE